MTHNILLFTGFLVWLVILACLVLLVFEILWRTVAGIRDTIWWRLQHHKAGTKPKAPAWKVFCALWLGRVVVTRDDKEDDA